MFIIIVNKKFFLIVTVFVIAFYVFMFYSFKGKVLHHRVRKEVKSAVVLPYVVVHIDLKGSPPKLTYLNHLLPILKQYGVNGLLIEYEDMFPYEGDLKNLSAINCYDRVMLKKFLTDATENGFEIIPLVQTFGHMESVLKLEEFMHLRENSTYIDSICPNKYESRLLIEKMLKQVIKFHSQILPVRHFHIGFDEVYHIKQCSYCRHTEQTDIDIFLHHLRTVSRIIKNISPQTTILIWEDMFRSPKIQTIRYRNILKDIQAVCWDYQPDVQVTNATLFKYHKSFKDIWIASAFKGADGRDAFIPDIEKRLQNHLSWMRLIHDYKFAGEKEVKKFKGIILTGWSRYSHMDPLCETLPLAYPSLIANLILIKKFRTGVTKKDIYNTAREFFNKHISSEFKERFSCEHFVSLDLIKNITACRFFNIRLFEIFHHFQLLKSDFQSKERDLHFMNAYSEVYKLNRMITEVTLGWILVTLEEITKLDVNLNKYLTPYYNQNTIDELIFATLNGEKEMLLSLLQKLDTFFRVQTWERNPGL